MSTSSLFVALTTSVHKPETLFNAFIDSKTTLPKAAPKIVKSVNYIRGNGNPGSILLIDYVEGTYGIERIEFVDDKKYEFKYSVIDGAPLGNKFKKISAEIKIEAIDTSGNKLNKVSAEIKIPPNDPGTPESSVTLTGIYETKDNNSIDPEELRSFAEKALDLLKLVDNYLIDHP